VGGRQRVVGIAQVVLAELRGHVALAFEQLGDRYIPRLQSFLRSRQTDLQHAGAEAALGDAVNVRRFVTHHALVVGADVPVTDVVAPDDEDVRLLGLGKRTCRRNNESNGDKHRESWFCFHNG